METRIKINISNILIAIMRANRVDTKYKENM